MEGTLGGKTFKSFQDLKRYKAENFRELAFVEEICRGIAVNTKYSSNIQVIVFSITRRLVAIALITNFKCINFCASFFILIRLIFPGYLSVLFFLEARDYLCQEVSTSRLIS